jgi:hypothetical protein
MTIIVRTASRIAGWGEVFLAAKNARNMAIAPPHIVARKAIESVSSRDVQSAGLVQKRDIFGGKN